MVEQGRGERDGVGSSPLGDISCTGLLSSSASQISTLAEVPACSVEVLRSQVEGVEVVRVMEVETLEVEMMEVGEDWAAGWQPQSLEEEEEGEEWEEEE